MTNDEIKIYQNEEIFNLLVAAPATNLPVIWLTKHCGEYSVSRHPSMKKMAPILKAKQLSRPSGIIQGLR